MRGKAVADLDDTLLWGITPAYAGKSKYVHHRQVKTVDHPRVCGEKIDQVRPDGVVAGSPPRVRGKALAVSAHAFKCRITPACAGKSSSTICCVRHYEDHPRVCGEKMSFRSWIVSGLGSPPRMRGKEEFACSDGSQVGITPAYAGKRRFQFIGRRVYEDHPRVCGEKLTTFDSGKLIPGSPPRMRGKVTHGYSAKPVCRITPAYAGKRSTGVQGPRPL